MGDCLLCPPGDRHVPDDQLADHVRIVHPDAEEPERWPDGGLVVVDQEIAPSEFGGQP